MTLVERTIALKDRCANLGTLGERIEEARTLGTRLAELRRVAGKLPDRLNTIGMLAQVGIGVETTAAAIPQVRNAVTKIKTRFAQTREAEALTRGQDWKVLMRELPKVVGELEEAAADAWEKHAQHLFAGDAPAAVERTLAPTDANKKAIEKYRLAHDRFIRLKTSVPASREEIAELARVAEELRAVKFDYDVPAAVRKFLEALPAGAPLTLLTDEVRKWIDRQGLSRRYQVVVTGR